eukprot:766338-Hanusia_phi.AAC.2
MPPTTALLLAVSCSHLPRTRETMSAPGREEGGRELGAPSPTPAPMVREEEGAANELVPMSWAAPAASRSSRRVHGSRRGRAGG